MCRILLILLCFLKLNSFSKNVEIVHFGQKFNFTISNKLDSLNLKGGISQKKLQQLQNLISKNDIIETIDSLNSFKKNYNLDDYTVIILVDKFAEKGYKNKTKNFREVIKSYILNNYGFDTQLHYNKKYCVLVGNCNTILSKNIAYQSARLDYLPKDTILWYSSLIENNEVGGIFSKNYHFNKNFDNLKQIDLINIATPTFINNKTELKIVQFDIDSVIKRNNGFDFYNIKQTVNYSIDKNFVEYLKKYPPIDEYKIILKIPFSEELRNSFIKNLKSKIQNLDTTDGLQYLQRFVSVGIDWKEDFQINQQEKVDFPEVTLDKLCGSIEDKSILYAKLVKEIYNFKMILILRHNKDSYSPHYCIGINFKPKISNKMYNVDFIKFSKDFVFSKYQNLEYFNIDSYGYFSSIGIVNLNNIENELKIYELY